MSSNNRKYTIILFLVLVIFVCFIWGVLINYKRSYEAKYAELETKSWSLLTALTEEKSKNYDLKESILVSMDSKGMEIPKELRIKLKPHKIYLRLNEEFCMSCYDSTIKVINRINDLRNDKNIGIVGSFKSMHEYKELMKDFHDFESIETFNLPSLDMGKLDELHMPFLFEINEDGSIESLCLLIKGEEDLIQPYINSISHLKQ